MNEGYIITTSLNAYLNETCKATQIPGMALLVYKDGEPFYEKNYGYRNVEAQQRVTKDTVFGAASLTKSVVCLAIMQLEDAGKLAVDDPAIKWLPNAPYDHRATIHHLMTHTSGLPGLDAVNMARAKSILNDPDGPDLFGELPRVDEDIRTVEDVLKVLAKDNYELLGEPGFMFNYSNESYALLQAIIEKASGQSFIDYMDEHILEPLEMDRSTFLTADLEQMENVTELYAFKQGQDKKKKTFHSPVWWDVGLIYSNGSLKSTAVDLIKYLEVYRQDGFVNGRRIVSANGIEKMRTSQYVLPNDLEYGYGLIVDHSDRERLYGHGGGIKGVSSYMLVAEGLGLTVVILTNIADVPAGDIALETLNYLFDLPLNEKREHQSQLELTDKELDIYAGRYQSAEGQQLDVYAEDHQIHLLRKQNVSTVKPYSDHIFVFEDGKKVAFLMNDDQSVKGIFSGLRFLPKIS